MKKFLLMALLAISAMSCSTDDSVLGVTEGKSQVAVEETSNNATKSDIAYSVNYDFNYLGEFNIGQTPRNITAVNTINSTGETNSGLYVSSGKNIYYQTRNKTNNSFGNNWKISQSFTSNVNAMTYDATTNALYVITADNNLRKFSFLTRSWSIIGSYNGESIPSEMFINNGNITLLTEYTSPTSAHLHPIYTTSLSNINFKQNIDTGANFQTIFQVISKTIYSDVALMSIYSTNFYKYGLGTYTDQNIRLKFNVKDITKFVVSRNIINPIAITQASFSKSSMHEIHFVIDDDNKSILSIIDLFR